jgi:hypothetical protein
VKQKSQKQKDLAVGCRISDLVMSGQKWNVQYTLIPMSVTVYGVPWGFLRPSLACTLACTIHTIWAVALCILSLISRVFLFLWYIALYRYRGVNTQWTLVYIVDDIRAGVEMESL